MNFIRYLRGTPSGADIVYSKGLKGGPAGLSLGILGVILGVILGGKNRDSFPQKNTHIRIDFLIDSTVYLIGSMGDFSQG